MNDNLKIYQEERPWGFFRRFTHNTLSTVKIISVKPNEQLSLQSHKKREEFWRVVGGSGMFQIGNERYDVEIGSEQFVPVETKHTMKAGDNGMEILEIALGEFDEEDITRYEDKYGRV
ncbi:MAG: phosphomannose isomerase type II C-terminal cupin domain [Candidatus Nomurabacteria bacterium]|nr:phosphomannose isomerase type II C-terminal cupin domain [Candidatus Nomurabacteria bacterium]